MNIRWLWGNYIEPEWKLSREHARQVHRIVRKRHVRQLHLIGLVLAWWAIVLAAVKLLHMPVSNWIGAMGIGYPFSWLAGMAAIVLPAIVVAAWTFRWVYTRPVRMAMRELGYDVCPGCGYWLHGLNDDVKRCPECGAQREAMPRT
jgi:hypothetical protein